MEGLSDRRRLPRGDDCCLCVWVMGGWQVIHGGYPNAVYEVHYIEYGNEEERSWKDLKFLEAAPAPPSDESEESSSDEEEEEEQMKKKVGAAGGRKRRSHSLWEAEEMGHRCPWPQKG